jgi:hypothetical protein
MIGDRILKLTTKQIKFDQDYQTLPILLNTTSTYLLDKAKQIQINYIYLRIIIVIFLILEIRI